MRYSAVRIDPFWYLFLVRSSYPPGVISRACFDRVKLSELAVNTLRILLIILRLQTHVKLSISTTISDRRPEDIVMGHDAHQHSAFQSPCTELLGNATNWLCAWGGHFSSVERPILEFFCTLKISSPICKVYSHTQQK
ncbi:hypothetical protein BT93_F0558 [Corymbia citriodora subsp. variegata]|nr:hypothetical protein BT93_F0558 [Corymbia citriodora subsp. variegata]KAF8023097.1 hypothetical protein BT93_F0558 [Corymbia citriodora subsp. variegata]